MIPSSEILPIRDCDIAPLVEYFEDKRRLLPVQHEPVHLIGTQDTENFVESMHDYLATHL